MISRTNSTGNFPPAKTDKPRPHICTTCTRSFARLEHLKRHERSHTKEKPFECPECTRCFARRDLLLRHQQKLHLTTMPPSRQKSGRRESTSSATGPGKVRKLGNCAQGATGPGAHPQRPRANTIGHVDTSTLGMLEAVGPSGAPMADGMFESSHGFCNSALPDLAGYNFRGMSTAAGHHGYPQSLPKLETNFMHHDIGCSLRTAPPYGGFGGDSGMQSYWCEPNSTVNPAQLHFARSPEASDLELSQPPYPQYQIPVDQSEVPAEANFGWLCGFEKQMPFGDANEQAINESSPSDDSPVSPSETNERLLDNISASAQTTADWQTAMSAPAPLPTILQMDFTNSPFPQYESQDGVSPKSHQAFGITAEPYMSSPPLLSNTPLSTMHQHDGGFPQFADTESLSNTTGSLTGSGSNRHSSITSIGADSINDATRQALLSSLSQPNRYCHANQSKYGLPRATSFPSTMDLQRFVGAYIQYFHPHLPFLHLPSLSFDVSSIANTYGARDGTSHNQHSTTDGSGALILAMAAIGAFYEYERVVSKELFELARKMIKTYLDQRCQSDHSVAYNHLPGSALTGDPNPPLWLVQAMLLNVIYGHNCGEKRKIDAANSHCAALAGLAQAVEFARPLATDLHPRAVSFAPIKEDIEMTGAEMAADPWNAATQQQTSDGYSQWQDWVYTEERKRTLYAVFVLSSMLVSAYNQPPTLMNSEINLDLPCDEDLWAAESFEAWNFLGGAVAAETKSATFAAALTELLTASQRLNRRSHPHQSLGFCHMDDLPETNVQPSAFGCLVLINALHNYIWETRQRHIGRQWTPQETDSMHYHLEPALKAFQAAWASNPQHSVDRTSKTETGTLSADCIPLLDLAYIRLFVNLGPSKEALWRRDWNSMAYELAHGSELVQHAEFDLNLPAHRQSSSPSVVVLNPPATQRERQLRKAAFHAANSLVMSDKLGVTFADFTSRELPMSSSLCAFDCAQILAEWVAAVQDRVGRYVGILGKDDIDLSQAPGIVLLEDEDCNLLDKINTIIRNVEVKLRSNGAIDAAPSRPSSAMAAIPDNQLPISEMPSLLECGYGSKILLITASMLEKAAVWPVMLELGQSLHAQAVLMKERAEASVLAA